VCVPLLEGILRLSEGCEGCAGSVHTTFAIIVIIEKLFGREPSQPSEPPQHSIFSFKWDFWLMVGEPSRNHQNLHFFFEELVYNI
jgi:hypothetical protein